MLILAIDSATKTMGAALADEQGLLGSSSLNVGKTHSARLVPVINQLLISAELTLAQVDAIAVTVGPGSFTGLRIGIATAKGLAHATGKPTIPIITLDALAENLRGQADYVCPILDARRDEVYCALYNRLGEQVWQPAPLSPRLLAERLQGLNGNILFNGDAATLYFEQLAAVLGERAILAKPGQRLFLAESTALLGCQKWQRGEVVAPQELAAVYLRLSQAERLLLGQE